MDMQIFGYFVLATLEPNLEKTEKIFDIVNSGRAGHFPTFEQLLIASSVTV